MAAAATAAKARASGQAKKINTMRPPPVRPAANRAHTATPTLGGRTSPAESSKPTRARTPKRKIDADEAIHTSEETNINVFVRCRGRNEREVRENSGVVVSTEGTKGDRVVLSMGPSALSNKTYSFDKVFSPAADQGMIFDEVVAPILNEVLDGFNCTIFAYGQTGTGKTYTMSGDITDVAPLPDEAGIIPRVLHTLFDKLGDEGSDHTENVVKCSFIELYNEELRDLLSVEDSAKLKIFDEANKQGRSSTLVQGMEETHIKTASRGIRLLSEGSHRRQVAATKCNDLSSRSHTVFTITVYTKHLSDNGEDFVSAGKLNLVDLAGSENIQRSGAENKRATEAGLINKSLLTLGRVINALVDKSSHIPYRESKLTRLLQDSLGGRTKTCIIATLSPAKSNLEETISTLDYAFRAKNIRNKPQINQMISKKTLLREFTIEIEKLKSELIATRQRNGVYLTAETYEEITTESESRRILSEEQRDKLETAEAHLRNKVQELYLMSTNLQVLKHDHEHVKASLDSAKNVLEQTEIILEHTRNTLKEETLLREAHQTTERELTAAGEQLVEKLETTTNHIDKLHSKLRRRSDLHSSNRDIWHDAQAQVTNVSSDVALKIEAFRKSQSEMITLAAEHVQTFIAGELLEMERFQTDIREHSEAFAGSAVEIQQQRKEARDEMAVAISDITALRDNVKQKMSCGLESLSDTATRIGAGIASELGNFHRQLEDSYVGLGREFKILFDDMVRQLNDQKLESERLRQQIEAANAAFVNSETSSHDLLAQAVQAEKETSAIERATLLARISDLVNETATAQDLRRDQQIESANKRFKISRDEYRSSEQAYGTGIDKWAVNAQSLIDTSCRARDVIKTKLQNDWNAASSHSTAMTRTAATVHEQTVRNVAEQMNNMDQQLISIDEVAHKISSKNEEDFESHMQSLRSLAKQAQDHGALVEAGIEASRTRNEMFAQVFTEPMHSAQSALVQLEETGPIRTSLDYVRRHVQASQIEEYMVTGETPAKATYSYGTVLPRTEDHETLLARMRGETHDVGLSPSKELASNGQRKACSTSASPSKTEVFADRSPYVRPQTSSSLMSLRELDVNIALPSAANATVALGDTTENTASLGKLKAPESILPPRDVEGKLPPKRLTRMTVAGMGEGRENVPPKMNLSSSVGPRVGRRLRTRGSD